MKVVDTDLSDNERVFECPWTVDNRALTVPIAVPASPVSGTVTIGFAPKADGAGVTAPVQLWIDGGNSVWSEWLEAASTRSGSTPGL